MLSKFLSGEIEKIEPSFDPKCGYTYDAVEAIVNDSVKAETLLVKLYESGILARELQDEVVFCPKCSSAGISIRYCCPYCKSFNIKKSYLIEHVKCGYMDVEANFHKGDKLVCPKCNDELRKPDVDYRRAGVWCSCRECGKSFDIPIVRMFCRSCREDFTFEDAVIKDVYAYTLMDEARKEASDGLVLISPVCEFFKQNGFEVASPAFLKGKSGANHMFDIAASKGKTGENITVVDLASSAENVVSEQPVIAMFAKIFDVSPNGAYLIAIPRLNDNARKMAELYNIQTIEAKNQKEAIDKLKEKVTKTK